MTQLAFDEAEAARIEAIYLIGDARRRRATVHATLAAAPSERILDVGCGPGFYCAEISRAVGPDGTVVGLDASPAMLELARRRCAELDNVELARADATSLPVDDASVDAAVSVQVLEYVGDVATALAELHRTVRPGGRVVIWDIDWATLSMHAGNAELTRRVLGAWDEHLAHRSLPRTLARRMREAGFEDVCAQAHPLTTIEFDDDAYGAALVPFIGGFVRGRTGLTDDDAQAWVDEQRALGRRGEFYFAVTQLCFTARRR
jgi:ubiquinone/menaquinone biosynthesis C-methylase UbiE